MQQSSLWCGLAAVVLPVKLMKMELEDLEGFGPASEEAGVRSSVFGCREDRMYFSFVSFFSYFAGRLWAEREGGPKVVWSVCGHNYGHV